MKKAICFMFLIMTACDTGRINNYYTVENYSFERISVIPFTHALYAWVDGEFGGEGGDRLSDIVNAAVQPRGKQPNPDSEYVVRFIFGTNGLVPLHQICSDTYVHTGTGQDLSAALCYAGKTFSALSAIPPAVTADDPKFKSFVRSIAVKLFPRCNPDGNC